MMQDTARLKARILELEAELGTSKQDTARLDHLVWRCNTWKDNWLDDSLLTAAWNLMEASGVVDGDYHRWVRAAIDADMKRLARRQKRRGQ